MINGVMYLVSKATTAKPIKILPVNRVIESRMALKLDDLIGKKKEAAQILDLSKATANNSEEFKRIMEKVPEFRIKPEKLKPEDIKSFERESRGRRRKPKKAEEPASYQFADPVPEEMRSVKLSDLCPVNIQWNMLTTLRPKSKTDNEYFSRPKKDKTRGKASAMNLECFTRRLFNERRLVELGKLVLATQEKEKKITDESFKRKMKNRSGVVETRYISCAECGEDFCQKESCTLFTYENFRREPEKEVLGKKEDSKRGRALSKTKNRKTNRSKTSKKRKGVSGGGDKSVERRKSKNRSVSRSKSAGRTGSKGNIKTKPKPSSKSRSPSKSKDSKKLKTTICPKKRINKI
ncbi:uncharacterized protein LOC106663080 [Cimex lectularius]|uniref:Uncharacterized protein n=1 Tax=Cimex lectularius TaxID=79782 RepID=A0A8I6SV83_CIMLE|nr:uncharacterized protein LOC106663080 [Cimex lectularius]